MSEQGGALQLAGCSLGVHQGRDRGVDVHEHPFPVLLTLELTLTRSQE